MSSYIYFADELLMAVYRDFGRTPQRPCPLRAIIAKYGLDDDSDWIASVTSEFANKGFWTVEIGDGPLVHLTADGMRHAEALLAAKARGEAISPNSHLLPPPQLGPWRSWGREIDWTKWGTVLTGLGIVVAVALWKFS